MYTARTLGAMTAAGFENPVVPGLVHPVSEIAYLGPNPLDASQSMLQLLNGNTWTWAGGFTGPVIGSPAPPASLVDATNLKKAADQAAAEQAAYYARTQAILASIPPQQPGESYTAYSERYHQAALAAGLVDIPAPGAGLPPTFPVPFARIPGGSTVYIPAPGTLLEPTITLPGAPGPVPVSAVPPGAWVPPLVIEDGGFPADSGVPTVVMVQGRPVTVRPGVQVAGTGINTVIRRPGTQDWYSIFAPTGADLLTSGLPVYQSDGGGGGGGSSDTGPFTDETIPVMAPSRAGLGMLVGLGLLGAVLVMGTRGRKGKL